LNHQPQQHSQQQHRPQQPTLLAMPPSPPSSRGSSRSPSRKLSASIFPYGGGRTGGNAHARGASLEGLLAQMEGRRGRGLTSPPVSARSAGSPGGGVGGMTTMMMAPPTPVADPGMALNAMMSSLNVRSRGASASTSVPQSPAMVKSGRGSRSSSVSRVVGPVANVSRVSTNSLRSFMLGSVVPEEASPRIAPTF
jgi:hypothetical protein